MTQRSCAGCSAWLGTVGASFVVYERQVQPGTSERMVVSPGHEADAILHLPGGQSGHPLSAHYRDQYRVGRAGAASWRVSP
ncbi:MAG: penicillin acylase family protein [Pseudomonadota bacterium]|nr:penicillin acylase family protein [Pseudomonadota bacterium]